MTQDNIKSWLTTGKVGGNSSAVSFGGGSGGGKNDDDSDTPTAAMERYLTWLESEVQLNKCGRGWHDPSVVSKVK